MIIKIVLNVRLQCKLLKHYTNLVKGCITGDTSLVRASRSAVSTHKLAHRTASNIVKSVKLNNQAQKV